MKLSLGLGIFLSSLVISVLLLYRWTGERWKWGKGLKWFAILSGSIFLILVLSVWGYTRFKNRVTKQSQYYDVALGMSKNEVSYIRGTPNNVYSPKGKDGWASVIEIDEIEKGKSIKDFNNWAYDVADGERVDVDFDPNKGIVFTISCFSHRLGSCRSVLGIGTGSTEEAVLDKFGQPDKKEIEDGIKRLVYSNLNLSFLLEQKKVYMIIVSNKL